MNYCVSCGKKEISGLYRRCHDCFILRSKAKKETKKDWNYATTKRNGMSVTYMKLEPWCAQFCTYCGNDIDMMRIKYATEKGGECYKCKECKQESKYQ